MWLSVVHDTKLHSAFVFVLKNIGSEDHDMQTPVELKKGSVQTKACQKSKTEIAACLVKRPPACICKDWPVSGSVQVIRPSELTYSEICWL